MGLERVHRTSNREHFGPVRLGPQDLRDIAAIFKKLDAEVQLRMPDFRTTFHVQEHRTDDVEDVLGFTDADTLPGIHVISGGTHLSFAATPYNTVLDRPNVPEAAADQRAIRDAAEKVRQIIRARQLGPLAVLRQRGPDKWLLAALFGVPAVALVAGQPLLDNWLARATSAAVASVVVWLSVLLLVLLSARPKDSIRLRGRDLPWWERRQGLIALVGLAVTVVIAFVK